MKINFFCPIWGMVPDYVHQLEGSLEAIFEEIKHAGYDGVEMAIPLNDKQKYEINKLKADYEMEVIALQYAAHGNTLAEFMTSYGEHIRSAADVKPLLINSHTGSDFLSFEDNCALIHESIELAKELDMRILHETHRGRFSFHAAAIQPYLEAFPSLRITADFSHWCNVSESFLTDQGVHLDNAIQRAGHLHARIGHPQACQVNDPRAPEWRDAVNHHLNWWDKIIANQIELKTPDFTITPEFGPADYMPTIPYTRKPVASQWEVNLWMKALLKKRYSS
ncbi:MAG: sugar phosphate isomerase/epimerase [Pedobacter sp.]|nr:MAG: sugar phosphate isomerase/epimerase [Pedobacter sp.]